jgi:hypothetical protein
MIDNGRYPPGMATLFVYQRQRVYANFKQAERYSYTTTIELGLRIC